MTREKLPERRRSITVDFDHVLEYGPNGLPARSASYIATLGYYDDGRLGEIFIESAQKVATSTDIAIRDAAIGLSIGLQYGVPIQADSFLHDASDRPEGALGQLLAKITNDGLLTIAPWDRGAPPSEPEPSPEPEPPAPAPTAPAAAAKAEVAA